MVKIDGQFYDIPTAQRGFHRYTSQDRADRRASFRLGYRQREMIGEVFWTHELAPGLAFPTKNAAYRHVLSKLSNA